MTENNSKKEKQFYYEAVCRKPLTLESKSYHKSYGSSCEDGTYFTFLIMTHQFIAAGKPHGCTHQAS